MVRLRTDLPAGTRLMLVVTCPSEEYVWTNVEQSIATQKLAGGSGFDFVRSIEQLDQDALHKYRHWKGRWPGQIAGLPREQFLVATTLAPAGHQFGVCNRDLRGTQVTVRKNGHWIERETQVLAPLPNWLAEKLP